MGSLEGRVAIITAGAATGIGFAAADRLAREGAVVEIVDIKGHGKEAAEKLPVRNRWKPRQWLQTSRTWPPSISS